VAVVGAGLAGAAASLFAAASGLDTVQIGPAGGVLFTTGLFDLLSVTDGRTWDDPWAALAALRRSEPLHPLAGLPDDDIRAAFADLVAALAAAGLDYEPPGRANYEVPTALGTTRPAFCVPRSMIAGARALAGRWPCLVVGFQGLREFSAAQVAAGFAARWPGLRAVRLPFPGHESATENYLAHMARALELAETRERLAAAVRPHLADARAVALPAVLGMSRSRAVQADLEARLGVPLFELPTLPTSVPGLRLEGALEAALAARGVKRLVQWRVHEVTPGPEGLLLGAGRDSVVHTVRAEAVILATGRFAGRGLVADRQRIREPLLDLPVDQPDGRDDWHRLDFFDPAGHPVNRAGLRTDERFRPLGTDGTPAHQRLYAVGSILAHQDWVRSKSGAGLAFATARAAVRAVAAVHGVAQGAARGAAARGTGG
jgi:glycerol-3-phosphate dehydrogenase subunit B